jgi:putative restriction endonuclease
MPVTFSRLEVGKPYTRPQLAEQWGYQSYHAIARGAVTPADSKYIVLFITKNKQSFLPQYKNTLTGTTLSIEGETSHTADERFVNASAAGDEIHLFYREDHHTPFEYKGEVTLSSYERRHPEPSRFVFKLQAR